MPAHLGTRVLIADSDETLRQTLFDRLLELKVSSDCVTSVNDAITKLDQNEYAIAIIDVALPGGDVHRLIGRISEVPRARRPIVLVLAANVDAARSLDVEIVQIVLRKPVRLTHLIELTRSCLRGAEARPAVRTDSEKDKEGDESHKTS